MRFFPKRTSKTAFFLHILYNPGKEEDELEKHKQDIPVHCYFAEEGECAEDLILESFRTFIDRNLLNNANFLTKRL